MQANKREKEEILQRQRLIMSFRKVVYSVREACTLQPPLEKEQQMRRLMQRLRSATGARTAHA